MTFPLRTLAEATSEQRVGAKRSEPDSFERQIPLCFQKVEMYRGNIWTLAAFCKCTTTLKGVDGVRLGGTVDVGVAI